MTLNLLMKIINKKARHEFQLLDRFEAGIVLTGAEVKSVKLGRVSLRESYARIIGSELFLINANISPYSFADNSDYEAKRSRKLLMHKREILRLTQKIIVKNTTLVPTAIYTKKGKIKVEIALAKGKQEFEKREAKRRKDLDREAEKVLKKFG
jgi:SsrA-binding protein